MLLNRTELCRLLDSPSVEGDEFLCSAVTEDSRRARPGSLFVAVAGGRHDGHAYADKAVEAGAVAIAGDRAEATKWAGVPYLYTPHPRAGVGRVAHALAGNPSETIRTIGVTGTNGKSSTVRLVHAILTHAGHPTAQLGTLGYTAGGKSVEAPHTTPFAEDLAALFHRAVDAGDTHLVMEVSSHALDQERVAGIRFELGAFTNLTQDHLDYHADMAAYAAAKRKLFARLPADGVAAVNREDAAADGFIAASTAPVVTYGAGGDVRADNAVVAIDGSGFTLASPWGRVDARLPLRGRHNLMNALCAATVCGGAGIDVADIAAGLESVGNVPGRFESVDAGQDFAVIVDYAHTEDGLRNVLSAARALCDKRLIVLFGCGGDRDTGKRPKMAAAAAAFGNLVVLTSDNPRTENPIEILEQVEVGLARSALEKGASYWVIPDRREGIAKAIALAAPGDMVVIAGKGHEDYQILGTERIHFDDREVAREILEAM